MRSATRKRGTHGRRRRCPSCKKLRKFAAGCNLVAPHYHAGLPPYRQPATIAPPAADNQELVRYRHALEAVTALRGESGIGDAALRAAREIAKKALAG